MNRDHLREALEVTLYRGPHPREYPDEAESGQMVENAVRLLLDGPLSDILELRGVSQERLQEQIEQAVGKALWHWGDGEPNEATGYAVRKETEEVTEAVMALLLALTEGGEV